MIFLFLTKFLNLFSLGVIDQMLIVTALPYTTLNIVYYNSNGPIATSYSYRVGLQ